MPTRQRAARYITKAALRLLNLPLLLFALWLPASASGQQVGCDATLRIPADHPYGYRVRGDRCEGIYIQEVSLATLLVASLTESYEDFDPRRGRDLRLAWSVPEPSEVRLRAHSLQRRLYYRMDAVRPAGSTSYTWPVGLLGGLGMGRPDLGVVAWMQHRLGGESRPIYLPLRVQQVQETTRTGRYQVQLVPGRELREVYLSLSPIGDDGQPGSFLQSQEPLRYGFYPAERAISIALPPLTTPGIYYLELAAELAAGGVITTAIYFFHGGG